MSQLPSSDADSLHAIRRAADGSEPEAMTNLAARLLVGPRGKADVPEAIALLDRAGEQGNTDAISLSATVAAMGVMASPDWPRALALLARAAGLGSDSAQRQLRILSGTAPEEWTRLSWDELARRVDFEAWRRTRREIDNRCAEGLHAFAFRGNSRRRQSATGLSDGRAVACARV